MHSLNNRKLRRWWRQGAVASPAFPLFLSLGVTCRLLALAFCRGHSKPGGRRERLVPENGQCMAYAVDDHAVKLPFDELRNFILFHVSSTHLHLKQTRTGNGMSG